MIITCSVIKELELTWDSYEQYTGFSIIGLVSGESFVVFLNKNVMTKSIGGFIMGSFDNAGVGLDRKCEVLFLNPPSPDGHVYIRDINRSGRRSRERSIWPQTSLAYLAAVAQEKGYSVNILDCIASEYSWNDYREYIKRVRPKWVVIQAISSVITDDVYGAYIAKRYGANTIIVGPHVTALAKETLEAYPVLDYGILGEAEKTIGELLPAVDSGQSIENIKGLVYRDDKVITVTSERNFIKNLDDLPLPLHELLPIQKYRLPYIGERYTFVQHSRGCPNACYFCRQNVMWKSVCRLRSPESICKELKMLNTLNISNVMFHADTFTQNKENVIGICKKIIEDGINARWICNGRVDTVDAEMLSWMKKAGCWMINYGIESGVQDILDQSNKGENATIERAREAVRLTKEAGIKVWGYFIIGLPGETKDTIAQTSRFARELPLDMVNFSVAAPYPGTPFFKKAEANGWLESVEWEDFDQNYSAIVNYPELSSTEIMKSVRKCYLQWYLRPHGIKVFLEGIRSFSDFKSLARIAWDHLKIKKQS